VVENVMIVKQTVKRLQIKKYELTKRYRFYLESGYGQ